MIPRIPEWYNENTTRAYPFKSTANLTAAGRAELPNDAILDFTATVRTAEADYVPTRLVSIKGGATMLLTIGRGATQFTIGVPGNVVAPTVVEGMGVGVFYHIVVGAGLSRLNQAIGSSTLLFDGAEFEPACVHVRDSAYGVDTIRAATPGMDDDLLDGSVKCVDGYNCVPAVTSDRFHLTARRGIGLGRYCEPLAMDYATCREIFLTINGQKADARGNIELSVSGFEIKRYKSRPHTLVIRLPDYVYENLGC